MPKGCKKVDEWVTPTRCLDRVVNDESLKGGMAGYIVWKEMYLRYSTPILVSIGKDHLA